MVLLVGSVGRKWISGISALALTVGLAVVAPATAQAAVGTSPRVLINEVYGGGGNCGATLKQDFIELYNGTSAAVDLGTYSVQYTSATGTGTWQVTPLTGTLPAGSTYVVREATQVPAAPPDVDRRRHRHHRDERNGRQGRAGQLHQPR